MENELWLFFEKLNFSNMIWQIITPLIFLGADVISGYIQAFINHNLDSSKMRTGLLHKVLLMIVIVLSYVIAYSFNIHIISTFVCIYIIIMEIMSIAENLKKAGVDLGKLRRNFKRKE